MSDRAELLERCLRLEAQLAALPLPPELIAQLEALGGMWTGAVSPWGSFEIYTPLCDPEPVCWCTPDALAVLIEEWQAQPLCRPPLRVWLGRCQ